MSFFRIKTQECNGYQYSKKNRFLRVQSFIANKCIVTIYEETRSRQLLAGSVKEGGGRRISKKV